MKKNTGQGKPVYSLDKDDFKKLEEKVLLNDSIKYQQEPSSNRHRGLTPIMISILTYIYKMSLLAKKRNQEFLGLTQYECQTIFGPCDIANDTVRENIKKLVDLRFLKVRQVQKSPKSILSYYSINENRFPCKEGAFNYGDDNIDARKLDFGFLSINCNMYPFCTCLPRDCIMIESLKHLRAMLTDGFINDLEKKMKTWEERDGHVSEMEQAIPDILEDTSPEHAGKFKLYPNEKRYFAEKIDDATYFESLPDAELFQSRDQTIKDIVEKIVKIHDGGRRKKSKKSSRPSLPAGKAASPGKTGDEGNENHPGEGKSVFDYIP